MLSLGNTSNVFEMYFNFHPKFVKRQKMNRINRRSMISAVGLAALGMTLTNPGVVSAEEKTASKKPCSREKKPLVFKNEDFYTDGKFDEEKGKDAIVALCRYFHFPMFPGFRDKLWVSDYGTGHFTELGLACTGYCNNDKDVLGQTFMLQDLFLLPGQMLPEHWHLKGEGIAVKNEGWVVRCGKSFIVGIGEDNLPKDLVIPSCHMNGTVETKHGQWATAGQYVQLAKVESKHWQLAGPEGCIISEVANLHTNSAVRHNDKAINAFFLK